LRYPNASEAGAGSGFPLQSFAGLGNSGIAAVATRKSISASIPSAAQRQREQSSRKFGA
jgi:hypothetical protein